MRNAIRFLLNAGLLLSLIGAVLQLVIMLLDLVLPISIRWYWGGSIAFIIAPVAFAVTARLLRDLGARDSKHA